MKICMVSDIYYPHPGGVSEHIHYLSEELRKRGHTVRVLTADYGNNRGWDGPDIIRVGRIVPIPANKSVCPMAVGKNLSNQVKKILRQNRFDIVHTHAPLAPMLPFLALMHSHSANFATFHAAREETAGYALFGPILQGYFRKIHGLIAVSDVARNSISRYFPGDYRIIPNGIDVQRFSPEVPPLERFSDGRPNILFVGRFDPRKGLRYLLQAFPYILRRFPQARLIVVGQGMLKNIYRYFTDSEAKESICFEGFVPQETLPRYYTSCDVFVSPATGQESFGIILLEAMASGKPIIASNIPGYRTVVQPDRDAILVAPKNPRRLAAAIIRVLKDQQLRQRLGTRGRERALRYSWAKVADEVEAYYREIITRMSSTQ